MAKAELAAVAHHDEVEKLKAELAAVNAKNKARARDHLLATIAVCCIYVHVYICKLKHTHVSVNVNNCAARRHRGVN